jgi:hypothetical protein
MSMKSSWIGAAVAAGAVMLAAPAFAGDTLCLWNHVPQAKRDAFLAKGDLENPQEAMNGNVIADADVNASVLACSVKVDKAEAAKAAFVGYAMTAVLGRWFEVHEKTAPEKLEAAWQGLTAADRLTLQKLATNEITGEPSKDTFHAFIVGAGFDPAVRKDLMQTPTGEFLFIYMMGRALRAGNEPKF